MEISITTIDKTSPNATISRFLDALCDHQLQYYAQDWMERIGYSNMSELHEAISPLIDAMNSAHINTSENVKMIYRCGNGNVFPDWKLSLLGLTYLAFNAPHKSPELRHWQLKILSSYLDKGKADHLF